MDGTTTPALTMVYGHQAVVLPRDGYVSVADERHDDLGLMKRKNHGWALRRRTGTG
jgi:hypothetical protein